MLWPTSGGDTPAIAVATVAALADRRGLRLEQARLALPLRHDCREAVGAVGAVDAEVRHAAAVAQPLAGLHRRAQVHPSALQAPHLLDLQSSAQYAVAHVRRVPTRSTQWFEREEGQRPELLVSPHVPGNGQQLYTQGEKCRAGRPEVQAGCA